MPILARPAVVFLDVGDTLMRADPSWPGVYLSALPQFGIQTTEQELGDAMRRVSADGPWDIEGPFEATEEASFQRIMDFDRRVLAELGHPDLPDDLFRAIEAAFDERASWHVFPDVEPALERLTEEGIRLAVISNWLWGAPGLLHDIDLARHFEALIISARVGYQKPHRAIFDHALEVMSIAPDRSIHVGDSFRADVVGARRAGITPVLIDRRLGDPGRLAADVPADDPVPVVSDLDGLLESIGIVPAADRFAPPAR